MSIATVLNKVNLLLAIIRITGVFSTVYGIYAFTQSDQIGISIIIVNLSLFVVNYLLVHKKKLSYMASCSFYLTNCLISVALLSILNTGGIYSPILVTYTMLILVAVLFFGRSNYSWFWLLVFIITFCLITFLNYLGYASGNEIDNQYNMFFYMACRIGISICAFFISMKYAAENEAANKVLLENIALSVSNEEKNVLIKEIHHRVKNNLQIISSLINLQANEINDPNVVDALNVTKNRIYAMSLIHQKLFTGENIGTVNFKEHTADLINYQKSTFYEVESEVRGSDINIGLDLATPLSLMVSELIINSFKHAFKNTIKPKIEVVITRVNEGYCELKIKDNGCGLPKTFDFNNPTSLGTEIVKSLIDQIEAKITYSTSSGGTEFCIVFNPNFQSSSSRKKQK